MKNTLIDAFGNIDIYLFDQLLKGRFDNCEKVLDIGCGGGRNLHYFLKHDYEVFGIDQSVSAINVCKALSSQLSANNSIENFTIGEADHLMFADSSFDLAIICAVLHFALDENHFDRMLREAFRILKPGGYFFARLASDIGIETLVMPVGNGRYLLPDGSERFLVNEQMLLDYTRSINGQLFEAIKTTNVQNLRCMTTWCVQKLG
jgi:tellurite methyltransferase